MTQGKPPRQEAPAPAHKTVYSSDIPAALITLKSSYREWINLRNVYFNDCFSITGFSKLFKAWLNATSMKLALDFARGTWLPGIGKCLVAILMRTPFVKTIMQELGRGTQRASPMRDSARTHGSESLRNPLALQAPFVIINLWGR